jgi:hypothetical protein
MEWLQYSKMLDWLNASLLTFKKCFSRQAAFQWFVVIVIGLMIRNDTLGVTSIIRELQLNPSHYHAMLHFFRSNAWSHKAIVECWVQVVRRCGGLLCEGGMPILIGDGVKQAKEARKMPCVKRQYQESENASKPSHIFGHMFGAIGVLAGNMGKLFCIPLSIRIHDGDAQINEWDNSATKSESHVVRIIRDASRVAKSLRKSVLLLDRYYLSVPALCTLLEEEATAGNQLLSLVMRAKRNPVAYLDPVRKSQRGRPPLKGEKINVASLFETCKDAFVFTQVMLYGKEETVSYLCRDLLWGKKLYQKLRFVLVFHGETKAIFVSTDLTLSPEQIIRLYGYRFKVECCFRELKQVIAGFAYRFWTNYMPKLKKYAKSGIDPLEGITCNKAKAYISSAYKAINGFVMASCIALGLLQICSLRFSDEVNGSYFRWLRTRTSQIPSEATTAHFMGKFIFRMFALRPNLDIIRFILQRQNRFPVSAYDSDFNASA